MFDGICIDARESFGNVRTCGDDFRINQQLSVRASKNGDISTSSQEDTDVTAKVLNSDFCCCGCLERTFNEAVCLGDKATRNKTSCGNRHASSSKKLAA